YPNSYIPTTFNWDTSASTAVYKWIFGSPTTSPRKIVFDISTNSLTVTTGQMDNILAGLGVAVGDSLVGQWDVWAFRNAVTNDSIKATNGPRAITLKRGVPPLTSFGLYTPASGTTIETSAFNSSDLYFNWATSGPGVTYKWKFGSPTISLVRLTYTSDISGIDSSFTIPNNQLDAALGSYGVLPGESLAGEWSVWAYNGFDSVQASASNALTLSRQDQAAVLVLYDSTNANCRKSKDSVVTNLNLIGLSHQLYNKQGVNSTNSISFRGYNCVMVLGEGSNVMSEVVKDSVKAYLNAGTPESNSKLIIFGEDVGYQFDRSSSVYYDSIFCRSMCGFQYVADRPGFIGQKGLTGIGINSDIPDSSNGPSMDVLKISLSVPKGQASNLYKYTEFTDSMNAIGRLSPNYNVAVFALDIEAVRPAYNSPDQYSVRRILRGALNYIGVPTGSENNNTLSNIPQTFSLSQNYPNPFNPTTVIRFSIPQNSQVSLKIYNSLGKQVAQLVNEKRDAGTYNIDFNASNLASGVYYYQIQAGDFVETKRMLLLK
ncbi:MAG TPA: T9SS type A sorting domain-containing protein, partial [Ignavibacteria bacterium]|nr:T9SS type A sorting domain-containing protein [Ignavibacteria bacterium]